MKLMSVITSWPECVINKRMIWEQFNIYKTCVNAVSMLGFKEYLDKLKESIKNTLFILVHSTWATSSSPLLTSKWFH